MVDAIVREWLRHTIDDDAMSDRVDEEIRDVLAAFYADDRRIQRRDPVRLQAAMDILVGLFERVGLRTDVEKMKVIVFLPGNM